MLETLQKIESTDKVKMTDTGRQSAGNSDLHWLGGFIDGEGSICIGTRKLTVGYRCHPILSITNTHKPSIERCVEILETQCETKAWVTHSNHLRRERKDVMCVHVCGMKRMQKLLPILIPVLFTKKYQAETLLEFINLRMGGSIRTSYGDEEWAIIRRLKDANRTGSSETTRAPESLALAI